MPLSVVRAEEEASWRFIEFFTANIRNRNTRVAYARAVYQFFECCEGASVRLRDIKPRVVAAYAEGVCLHSGGYIKSWTTSPRLPPHAWKAVLSLATRKGEMLRKPGCFQRMSTRLKRL